MAAETRPGPRKPFTIRCGDWLFKYRNLAFTAFLAALFIGFRPRPFLGDPGADHWLDLAGILVALAGSAFRFWVIGLAYIKRGGVNKKIHADRLVVSGMFGVCRNPLYVGNALVLLGLFLIHNNPWVYAIGLCVFGFSYWSMVVAEEWFLAQKFGDEYARYCADVTRFWPDFSRYSQAARGMVFNWRRSIIKDYSSIVAWVATVVALLTYERVLWTGDTAEGFSMVVPGGLLLLAAIFLVTVRGLKKSGLLKE
ncbi:MAG: methyltransferase family protein [Kiloniellaceae bacterium]